MMNRLLSLYDQVLALLKPADGLPLLLMRLYLVPVFWMAGSNKLAAFADTAEWFGNPDWGLGLPFPTLLAGLATGTELAGAALLLLGLGTRIIAIPLMVTMVVAALTVHWDNGWAAIAESTDPGVAERLERIRDILQTHGNYDWLTAKGPIVILNNGIEFAATYFIMLLALMFYGGGRYVSLDFWLHRWLRRDTVIS
jgi:uncharacterized membrane protein YphA (DoxX/SURF4 family)